MVLKLAPFEETEFGKEFWQMFWFSLFLHVAAIILIALYPELIPQRVYYAPPSLTTVDLVSMEQPKPSKPVPVQRKSAPVKPRAEKKIPIPETETKKTPAKPIPETKTEPKKEVKPEPVKKKAPPAKEYSDKEISSSIATLKKKVSKQRVADKQAIATRGRITSRLMEIKHRSYMNTILAIVQNEWMIPEGAQIKSDLETIIWVTIAKNGKVLKIDVEKSSGVSYFDNAVIRTIEKSSPFPPHPGDEDEMGLGFRFTPEGLQ